MPEPNRNLKEISGKTFGRWTVLSRAENRPGCDITIWTCRCKCGVTKEVFGNILRSGRSKSCGCLANELSKKRFVTHGHTSSGRESRAYSTWRGMLHRCENRNAVGYKHYGGRGITVCERWKKFDNFYADMGNPLTKQHSIDRIDNDGNYEPSNCRWATREEQSNNTSRSWCIQHDGYAMNRIEWANHLRMDIGTLRSRLRRGWTVKRALETATQKRSKV